MPIMENDPRGEQNSSARLLADIAVKCARNPAMGSEHKTEIENVFRMLTAWQVGNLEREVAEQVHNAFEDVMNGTFSDLKRDNLTETMVSVLRYIAYPDRFPEATAENRDMTRYFFESLKQRLYRLS